MAYSTNPHSVYCRERYNDPNDNYRQKSLEAKRKDHIARKLRGFVEWDNRPENKDQKKERHKRFRQKLRLEVLAHYGGDPPKCACCRFNDVRALQIDHIHGGGSKQRKKIKRYGIEFYKWLKQNNFPEGFQVLCANCNWIKRRERGEERGI